MTRARSGRSPRALLSSALLGALVAVVVAAGCGPDDAGLAHAGPADGAASPGADSAYHVWLKLDDVRAQVLVLVNGFPVDQTYGGRVFDNPPLAVPITTALVSGRNTVTVEAAPYIARAGRTAVVGPVRLRARVIRGLSSAAAVGGAEIDGAAVEAAFARWERDLQERWPRWLAVEDSLVASGMEAGEAAVDSAWAWARAHPVVVATSFVRPGGSRPSDGGPAFDGVFREAPALRGTAADSARLRDYAVHLGALLDAADAEAVYDEIGPAISDSTGWYQVTMEGTRESDLADIREAWTRFRTDFEPDDLGLRSWSGGRVWEVYRDDGASRALGKRALLLMGEDRLETWLRVYVGEVDGRLRVVRITS